MQIYYLPDRRLIETEQVSTVLNASLEAGIPHTHVCGGNARCSTCRVIILEGQEHCAPRTSAEQKLATQLGFEPQVRLACQTLISQSGRITLQRISLDAEDATLYCNQANGQITPQMMGQEKHLAILFSDIRGFTSFAENLPPYDVIYVLNRYFQRMAGIVNRYGGTINTYMGDGLMALFGVDSTDRVAERAVAAALEMLAAVEEFNPSLELLYQRRLRIGIGIHCGDTVIGSIGDPANPKVTAIGDAVNLASRIEAANKQLGTHLLISEAMYEETREQVIIGGSHCLPLPGKSGEYCLYEVNGIKPLLKLEPQPQPGVILHNRGFGWAWLKNRWHWLQRIF